MEFGKDSSASPDFTFRVGSAETITMCREFSDVVGASEDGGPGHGDSGHGGPNRGMPRALVSRFQYELGTKPVRESYLTNVSLTVYVTPMESTDTISGRGLWRVGLFGSSNLDGDGPRMGEVRQLLSPSEQAKTMESGSVLTLDADSM